MKKILKITAIILALPLIALGGLLAYSSITDYSPEAGSVELVPIRGEGSTALLPDTFRVMIWNVGYAGLGAEMDFFHDGGKMVRPSEERAAAYLKAISGFLNKMRDSVDFILLQEVDRNSKRSYFQDQMAVFQNELPGFYGAFALNYKVDFVPVPFRLPYEPYGATNGGLVSFSRYRPLTSYRIQYPGGFSWPTSLYMLDRCALEQRFRMSANRELVLVNTHNTAYDASGEIKKQEMAFIRNRYQQEAGKGSYVLLGGDWNQPPPGFQQRPDENIPPGYTAQTLADESLPKGFIPVFDSLSHTNRALLAPYIAGKTFTTLIDYFITSPNVRILRVSTLDMQFRWSDHQPVMLTVACN